MDDPGKIVELVGTDLNSVFEETLRSGDDGAGFQLANVTSFAEDTLIADPDGRVALVAWEWHGRHEGLFGVDATGEPVIVRGVTLVDYVGGGGDEPVLHRYVDWLDVMAQIGITVNPRPIVDVRRAFENALEVEDIKDATSDIEDPQ